MEIEVALAAAQHGEDLRRVEGPGRLDPPDPRAVGLRLVASMSKRIVPSAAWMCWLVIGPVRPEKEKRSTAAVWSRVSVKVEEPAPELAAPVCGVSEARKSVPPVSEGGGGGGGGAAR